MILKAWGNTGRLIIPPGMTILGDKGFDNTASCYTNYNTTLHPAFLTKNQFSRGQGNNNVEICKKIYTCEVVFSHVTAPTKLTGLFPRENFHDFEFIVVWAHGRANICYGYLQKFKLDNDDNFNGNDDESKDDSSDLEDDNISNKKRKIVEPVGLALIKATSRKRQEMKESLSENIDFDKISLKKLAKDQQLLL